MFDTNRTSALAGVRVLDAATIYAGPMIGTLLGDFGADVIKVEHPLGDGLRKWAWQKDDESLWWTVAGRNKRSVTLKLSDEKGAEAFRRLAANADILIENFRPGTLERWNLDPVELIERHPSLVVVRVSGFGQTGPYRDRPGFGTLAEAISGFAETNGPADSPPMLPQWPLADGVAALAGAFAAMVALREAEATGRGQVVDLSIYEPLFWILGAQTSAFDQLGINSSRLGNSTSFNAPRGTYLTRDHHWVALSGATTAMADRVMRAVGRPDLADAPWFVEMAQRVEHREELDAAIAAWVGARDRAEVLSTFGELGATVGPVYSIADIVADSHFRERGSVVSFDHPRLGPVLMQGLIARLERTPGEIVRPSPRLGEHSDEILAGVGYSSAEIDDLRREGLVGPRLQEDA